MYYILSSYKTLSHKTVKYPVPPGLGQFDMWLNLQKITLKILPHRIVVRIKGFIKHF